MNAQLNEVKKAVWVTNFLFGDPKKSVLTVYSEVPGGPTNKQNYRCIEALIDETQALPNHH